MKQFIVILAAFISALAFAPHGLAHTPHSQAQARAKDMPRTGRVDARPVLRLAQARISPAEAKAIALSRVPGGEVVDIRRSGDVYRVRIIDRNGHVVDIVVDARTGRVR